MAARENAISTKSISDLEKILTDLLQNAKVTESARLAEYVQNAMCASLQVKYSRIRNLGVKQAPFYVLLGAQMPAILIETSFISHQRECQRLCNPAYRRQLCAGIVAGIKTYIESLHPPGTRTPPTAELSESRL